MLNEIAPRTRPNRDDAGHVPGGRDIQAPFADEVLRLRRTRPFSEPIVSLHALPWGQGRSPGVPLAVPGQRWAPTLRQRVAASRRSGAEVYQLPPGPSHHPREHVS